MMRENKTKGPPVGWRRTSAERMTKQYRKVAALLSALIFGASLGFGVPASHERALRDDPIGHPDEFAWKVFAKINVPAATQGNNNVFWEAWADDEQVYGDPNKEPTWPSRRPKKRFRQPRKMLPLK